MDTKAPIDSNSEGRIMEAEVQGSGDQSSPFLEPVPASLWVLPLPLVPRVGMRRRNDSEGTEIALDMADDSVPVHSVIQTGGMARKKSLMLGHAVIQNASSQVKVKHVWQELERLGGKATVVAHAPKFLVETKGWPAVEKLFEELSSNGLLHRSMFGKCIGMDNLDFAGDLFDGLARRHGISADCVNKLELREFWEQVSDQGLDGRLQTIIDSMYNKSDRRLYEEDVKEIIILTSSLNKQSDIPMKADEYTQLIMEPQTLVEHMDIYG